MPKVVLASDTDLLLSLGKMEFPLQILTVRAALWPGSSTQSMLWVYIC